MSLEENRKYRKMNTMKTAIAAALLTLGSAPAIAEDSEWLETWKMDAPYENGSQAYVLSERFENSQLLMNALVENDCQLKIGPMQIDKGVDVPEIYEYMASEFFDSKEHPWGQSYIRLRVRGADDTKEDFKNTTDWSDVFDVKDVPVEVTPLTPSAISFYTPFNLNTEDAIWSQLLTGTTILVQTDFDDTDEFSLKGFRQAASRVVYNCRINAEERTQDLQASGSKSLLRQEKVGLL